MERIINIRKYLLMTSQVLGLLIGLYFLFQVRSYEISWNLGSYLFPKLTANINVFLHQVGTLILVIPLTIIGVSILIPQNIPLKIASSFFGMASTLITITSGVYKNTLGEIYNMKIFLITKILTLEDKIILYKKEYMNFIEEKYKVTLELYIHLKENLSNNNLDLVKQKLENLHDATSIKLYARETVQELATTFLKNKQELLQTQAVDVANAAKYLVIGTVGILTLFGIAVIVRMFFTSDAMIEGATLNTTTAKLASVATDIAEDSLKTMHDLITIVADNVKPVFVKILKKFISIYNRDQETIAKTFLEHEQRLNFLQSEINILQAKALSE